MALFCHVVALDAPEKMNASRLNTEMRCHSATTCLLLSVFGPGMVMQFGVYSSSAKNIRFPRIQRAKSSPANAGISTLLPGSSCFWVLIWKLLSKGAGTFLKPASSAALLVSRSQG